MLRDWIDAANVTDGQSAVARMASWAGCLVAMQEGVEPVMQLQCRDRNRIALQADLLGAGAVGMPNVLLLTGDHPRFGDHPDAKRVFDLDSIQLVWTARTMRDQSSCSTGASCGRPALVHRRRREPVRAAAAVPRRAAGKKVAAGAQFVQTQFIFDVPIFARWMAARRAISGSTERCWCWPASGRSSRCARWSTCAARCRACTCPMTVVRRLRGVPEDRVAARGWRCAPRSFSRFARSLAWPASTSWRSVGRRPCLRSWNAAGRDGRAAARTMRRPRRCRRSG